MDRSTAYASEDKIGPPSEIISIQEFLQLAATTQGLVPTLGSPSPSETSSGAGFIDASSVLDDWKLFSDELRNEIEEECSVNDIKSSLTETLSDPFLYVHVSEYHDKRTTELLRQSALVNAKQSEKGTQSSGKRKRADTPTSETPETPGAPETVETPAPEAVESNASQLDSQVSRLRHSMKNVQLKCWPYPDDSSTFVRVSKHSDINALTKLKKASTADPSIMQCDFPEALLFITIYDRLSWGNHISRSSQHVVLASQTLRDLYDVIPCISKELPDEKIVDDEIVGYEVQPVSQDRGCVFCIEDIAYGDGQNEEDYSDKLINHIDAMTERIMDQIEKGPRIHDVHFSDLDVRLNQPYWLLHQGSCEHYLVIEQIRLLNPTDPTEGYPITTHINPPIIDLCQVCGRVPATVSIVGDIRLGQSPCKLCSPCWRKMGVPNEPTDTLVVPLPEYKLMF